jgi:serine/threonine-protein kinase
MATVWVARLTGKHGFEKLVAIKTILPQYADDLEFQTMFLDEARLAARIRHPNVAEIMDLGEENGTLFLVMEWVDGDSLARLYNAIIKAGARFPIDVLVRIAADCCAGLHAAHELRDDRGQLLNVVHRDVSPQNVLVGTSGITKLIDFGVAKAAGRMSQETSAGLVKGKIQYASPEQAMGKTLDRRSDLWGLGTVMYQVLAGRLPYEGENQLATLHLLTSGKPPKPLPATVPPSLAAVIRKSLAYRPEDRYATALEMQQALEACISPVPTQSEVATTVQRFLGDRSESRKREVAEALQIVSSRSNLAPVSASSPARSTPALSPGDSNPGIAPPQSGVVAVAPFAAPDPGLPAPIPHVPTAVTKNSGKLGTKQWAMGAGALLTTAAVWTGVAVFALQTKASAASKDAPAVAASAEPAKTAEPPKTAEPAKTAAPIKTAEPAKTTTTQPKPPPVKTGGGKKKKPDDGF